MARQHPNPLADPLHYASPQMKVGPPATGGAAARYMLAYDYGNESSQICGYE